MIEKKRRDRINASLGELRRLVPAAARDPHSGKLEKAEILQLTVEHLRTLRTKGEFRPCTFVKPLSKLFSQNSAINPAPVQSYIYFFSENNSFTNSFYLICLLDNRHVRDIAP